MPEGTATVLTDMAELVDEKEKVRAFGQLQLQHLETVFKSKAVRQFIEGIEDWEDNLKTLKTFQNERQILIGIWGETGLGKSSLINALLGYRIVPTSQSSACTAAVCIFGYNNDTAGGNKFRAIITFKSWDTVKTELDALKKEQADLEDMRSLFENDPTSDFSGQYAEVERSIQSIMSWSGLSDAFIRKSSPEQILQNAKSLATDIFPNGKADNTGNHQEHIVAASERAFIRLLRQYVDSANKSSAPKYWPLVEKVKAFVDSPILRNGIKLVDLPGTSDAFGFRGEIAHSYQDRLDKVIVVTPATRAADNKAAADFILSENQTTQLDMDGMLKDESICVVVTKIDSMNCDTAETEFPTHDIVEKVDVLAEIEDALAEMEQHGNMVQDDGEDSKNVPLAGRKRANADQATCRAAKKQRLGSGNTDTNGKQERMDELQYQRDFIRSELKYLCIQERNKELKRKIKETLLDPSKRINVAEESVVAVSSVYPVSSEAFMELQKTPSIDGFPDVNSTGIPDLKAWLYRISLPYRQEWADADIHHIQVLIDAADGWTQANVTDLPRLSKSEVVSLQVRLDGLMKELGTAITSSVRRKLQQKLSHLEPLRKSSLTKVSLKRNLGKNGKETQMAMKNLRRFLEAWKVKNHWAGTRPSSKEDETHWSTYQACVKRHGGVFKRRARRTQPKAEIHWLGDVDLSFWRGHKDKWRTGFTQKFSTIKKTIHSSGLVAFKKWVESLHDDEGMPESFRELMKANTYKLDHLFDKYMTDVGEQINLFEKDARKERGIVQRYFSSGMRPGFEAAARIRGKQIKERQSQVVQKHVEADGVQMFRNARNALETQLAKLHRGTSKEVGQLWMAPKKGCGGRIRAEMLRVLKRSSISFLMPSAGTMMTDDAKAQIRTIVIRWRTTWHAVHVRLPRFVPVEEDIDSNAEEVDSENEEGDMSTEVQVKREPDEVGSY
ncbi:Tat pathway signal sequence [Colletotrichum higginsianum IMI 349063]|uniref:Tat pathway signal sequence n=2 Tax=Colletotrichum higginsianum (strain IMI 349063) TaxID=759273 RepID=A0A1B7XW58_COLHI|nr:Tat pathway signal sequence [Colletotrichum higginsianum IMI 349063]OBR03973.1 Tat pathway signal sequence [Colletotrichum higginsianum IMI 349063]